MGRGKSAVIHNRTAEQTESNGIGIFHTGGKFHRTSSRSKTSVPASQITLSQFMSTTNKQTPTKIEKRRSDKAKSLQDSKGYWESRVAKLQNQKPDLDIYSQLEIVKRGTLTMDENGKPQLKQIFKGLKFYLNGTTTEIADAEHGLSQLHLTHLSVLHGAVVLPYISKKKLTHVICESACQSKQERVLSLKKAFKFSSARIMVSDGVPQNTSVLHYVKPSWITQSIERGTILPERDFATFSDQNALRIDSMLLQNR